ncbi:MAG TPA: c-type cytochrome [Rubrivivax sp.]|nr:c-type cytochrome [Rubrivivax sp.]
MNHTLIGLALWAGLALVPAVAQNPPQNPAPNTSQSTGANSGRTTTAHGSAVSPPGTPAKAALPRAGAAVYDKACAACHASGVNNAPRVGDRVRWSRLVKEGPARVTAHGWLGERAMPPRGGVPDLALADFADAVAVMAERSQAKWPAVDVAHLQAVEREVQKESDKRAGRRASGKPAAR